MQGFRHLMGFTLEFWGFTSFQPQALPLEIPTFFTLWAVVWCSLWTDGSALPKVSPESYFKHQLLWWPGSELLLQLELCTNLGYQLQTGLINIHFVLFETAKTSKNQKYFVLNIWKNGFVFFQPKLVLISRTWFLNFQKLPMLLWFYSAKPTRINFGKVWNYYCKLQYS